MNENLYAERISHFTNELKKLKRHNRTLSLIRLLVFIIAISLVVFFFDRSLEISLVVLSLFIVSFLYLVKISSKYKYKIRFTHELIDINKNEISALHGDISNFSSGDEFIDNSHNYSFDLDIFGEQSIYQQINRTCTGGAAEKLANALKHPLCKAREIIERQEDSKDLANLLDWRQTFQATGNLSMTSETKTSGKVSVFQSNKTAYSNDVKYRHSLLNWLNGSYIYLPNTIIKMLLNITPIMSLVLILLSILSILPIQFLIIYVVLQLSFSISQKAKIDKIDMQMGKQIDILEKYELMLKLIENQDFTAKGLAEKKKKLRVGNINSCKELHKLKKLVKSLNNRNNVLFAFIANPILQWDVQCVIRMERWRKINKENLPQWLDVVYEFDFLSSYANFAYNNPDFSKPEILENDGFKLEMEQGGHPLLNSKSRVDNSILIDGYKKILLITGANMAGKSTFLRTIGVNMVLAMSGAVVCAKKFAISPINLYTSIRTNDSVQNNESYFFAELKRLKHITDRVKAGEKIFVIIDEMLRGTNSRDKHNGSQALIVQLIKYNTSGLLATHDIALGKLAEKHPKNIQNYRFEVEIENDNLVFDYKIKEGISQNLNATFLMKKMGIIDD